MDSQAPSLDTIGLRFGTDKSSAQRDYLSFYETFVGNIRHEPVKLLEIGVEFGSSLRMWEEYFLSGVIVGADMHPGIKTLATARILTEVIDPSNIEDLVQLGVTHSPFDIIIQNASPALRHQVTTFKTLFPFLITGGVYIAQDLHTSRGHLAGRRRGSPGTPLMEYIKKLVDLRAADEGSNLFSEKDPFLRTYGRHIDSFTFHKEACAIRKRYRRRTYRIAAPGPEFDDVADASLEGETPSGSERLSLLCHISGLGDRQSATGAMTVLRDDADIEGFVIYCEDSFPDRLEYRGRLANGAWTDWVECGQFAGTMGRCQNLTGFSVRLAAAGDNPEARHYDIHIRGLFRGRPNAVIVGGEGDCVAEGQSHELYGMQVVLRRRGSIAAPGKEQVIRAVLAGEVHHCDPSRLEPISKLIDEDYAPKLVLVPATSELRKPLPGRIWHDEACAHKIKRSFSAQEISFNDVVARTIDNPLLAQEMMLFDDRRMYLDTSIELEYLGRTALPAITQNCAGAITASVNAAVDDRFRDDIVLISHHEGGGTWGHYLVQSVPRMLVFLDAFPSGKVAVPAWHADGANGFGEALAFYNIPAERLAPIDAGTVYRLKQAVLLDFLFNFDVAAPHPKVLPLLRNFPLSHTPASSGKGAAFIKRRADSQRAIANEQAVDAVIERHNIEIYGPEQISLPAQVEIWQNHDLVITTLGSDLTNMVYARPGTRVLALSPHWFGEGLFFRLCVSAGVQWFELRCGDMAWRDEEAERFSSFNVDIDLLDSVLTSLLT